MKAAYFDKTGDADVLTYGDIPDPIVGPDNVLIKVRAISPHHVDTVVRSGARAYFKIKPPHVLGNELAGEVLEVGANITQFAPGDRVAALTHGSYAELAVALEPDTFHLPDNVSFDHGAAFPSTAWTAFQLVARRAEIRIGESVLVTAAASGTGFFIVQLAKASGARVIATAGSAEKRRILEVFGADETIDHYNEDVAERIKEITDGDGIDVAMDSVSSQAMFDAILSSLKPKGRLVTYGMIGGNEVMLNMRMHFVKALKLLGGTGSDPVKSTPQRVSDTRALLALAGRGELQTVVDRVLPLSEAADAHRAIERHELIGKVILVP